MGFRSRLPHIAQHPIAWGLGPLGLVVAALVGSVAIPARQTLRITRLLRESTEVLAPARLLEAQLHSGVAKELAALQRYVLTGDNAALGRYRTTALDDQAQLIALERLTARLDRVSAGHVDALRRRIDAWRQTTGALIAPPESRVQVLAALRAGQAQYDSTLTAFAALSSDLAAAAARRDDRVRSLEHLSLAANGALVLTALVAMGGVAMLTLRERRLTTTLHLRVDDARRRAQQEIVLRETAEALAGAYTAHEVTQRIARAALATLEGRGAFVEQTEDRAGESSPTTVVQAVVGTGVPPVGTTSPWVGSHTALVTPGGQPMLVAGFGHAESPEAPSTLRPGGGSTIVVPLGSGGTPTGALVVARAARHDFSPDDVSRAGILGHLATLAYEKVKLLEDAHERRRVLERVIQSRSRLMRGFSHDVKNPIGAADGFADLLILGVYGELSTEQRKSVDSIRRCLRGALVLIDDLHELARAETGRLALTPEPVDLAGIVRTLCEDYHAAARTAGLSLSVEVSLDLPIIETDRWRVRQIASNLLSNAIKYTERGSVLVRTTHASVGTSGDGHGWALVEVIDTGRGIPAHQHEIIFEEFSRLGAGEQSGAGLGLAISRLLARALGGDISVRSAPGQGSTFTLSLPLRRPQRVITASPSPGGDPMPDAPGASRHATPHAER